jgi:hypothetical protein
MSDCPSAEEYIVLCLEALQNFKQGDAIASNQIASFLYEPDCRLAQHFEKLKNYIDLPRPTPKQSQDAGYLLEEIMFLACSGLKGFSSRKSFCSVGAQYDLLITGDDMCWFYLCKLLYMKENQRDIIIEAKCTKSKVTHSQFARLCSLMEISLFRTTGLGIFFTLNGATCFPYKGQNSRQQTLSEARSMQVLFHARTGKAIIVLDKEDIFKLDQPGSLIQILISKIRDIEHLSGLAIEPCENPVEVDLPAHLKKLL